MPLTNKQEAFCHEYMVDLNATQAAIRAGYSKKTARQIGEQNLSKIDVAARVKELMDSRLNKADFRAEDVVNGFLEVIKLAKEAEKPDLVNLNRALENLGKHFGIFERDNKQVGEAVAAILAPVIK